MTTPPRMALVILLLARLLQDGRPAPFHPAAMDEEEKNILSEVIEKLSKYIDYKVRSSIKTNLMGVEEDDCPCEDKEKFHAGTEEVTARSFGGGAGVVTTLAGEILRMTNPIAATTIKHGDFRTTSLSTCKVEGISREATEEPRPSTGQNGVGEENPPEATEKDTARKENEGPMRNDHQENGFTLSTGEDQSEFTTSKAFLEDDVSSVSLLEEEDGGASTPSAKSNSSGIWKSEGPTRKEEEKEEISASVPIGEDQSEFTTPKAISKNDDSSAPLLEEEDGVPSPSAKSNSSEQLGGGKTSEELGGGKTSEGTPATTTWKSEGPTRKTEEEQEEEMSPSVLLTGDGKYQNTPKVRPIGDDSPFLEEDDTLSSSVEFDPSELLVWNKANDGPPTTFRSTPSKDATNKQKEANELTTAVEINRSTENQQSEATTTPNSSDDGSPIPTLEINEDQLESTTAPNAPAWRDEVTSDLDLRGTQLELSTIGRGHLEPASTTPRVSDESRGALIWGEFSTSLANVGVGEGQREATTTWGSGLEKDETLAQLETTSEKPKGRLDSTDDVNYSEGGGSSSSLVWGELSTTISASPTKQKVAEDQQETTWGNEKPTSPKDLLKQSVGHVETSKDQPKTVEDQSLSTPTSEMELELTTEPVSSESSGRDESKTPETTEEHRLVSSTWSEFEVHSSTELLVSTETIEDLLISSSSSSSSSPPKLELLDSTTEFVPSEPPHKPEDRNEAKISEMSEVQLTNELVPTKTPAEKDGDEERTGTVEEQSSWTFSSTSKWELESSTSFISSETLELRGEDEDKSETVEDQSELQLTNELVPTESPAEKGGDEERTGTVEDQSSWTSSSTSKWEMESTTESISNETLALRGEDEVKMETVEDQSSWTFSSTSKWELESTTESILSETLAQKGEDDFKMETVEDQSELELTKELVPTESPAEKGGDEERMGAVEDQWSWTPSSTPKWELEPSTSFISSETLELRGEDEDKTETVEDQSPSAPSSMRPNSITEFFPSELFAREDEELTSSSFQFDLEFRSTPSTNEDGSVGTTSLRTQKTDDLDRTTRAPLRETKEVTTFVYEEETTSSAPSDSSSTIEGTITTEGEGRDGTSSTSLKTCKSAALDFLKTLQSMYEDRTCNNAAAAEKKRMIETPCKCDLLIPIGEPKNKIYLAENPETPDVQELYVPILKISKKDKSFRFTEYMRKLFA